MPNEKDKKTVYNLQYAKDHVKRIPFNLNCTTDADIIEYLKSVDNVNGYLKQLIRKDMTF